MLGVAFEESGADIRNSKFSDVINELKTFGVEVFV